MIGVFASSPMVGVAVSVGGFACGEPADLYSGNGDPSRAQRLEKLYNAPCCVGELAEEVDEGMTTDSQRLMQQHKAIPIRSERMEKHTNYSLADDHIREILESVFDRVDDVHNWRRR